MTGSGSLRNIVAGEVASAQPRAQNAGNAVSAPVSPVAFLAFLFPVSRVAGTVYGVEPQAMELIDACRAGLWASTPSSSNPEAHGRLHAPKVVRAFIDSQFERIRGAGLTRWRAAWSISATRPQPSSRSSCASRTFDCVMIGAGLRDPEQFVRLFEKLLNVVHALAPGAKICFNSSPADSAEAVQRWL